MFQGMKITGTDDFLEIETKLFIEGLHHHIDHQNLKNYRKYI